MDSIKQHGFDPSYRPVRGRNSGRLEQVCAWIANAEPEFTEVEGSDEGL